MPATGGAVEGLDQLLIPDQYFASSLSDRPIRQGVFNGHPTIDLTSRRRADVVTLCLELAEVLQGVGSGRHRLSFESLDLPISPRAHFPRHDPSQILLHG